MRTPALALALLAACAPRPRVAHLDPPPRSWTERDLAVPLGPAVLPLAADGAARRPGYPDDRRRRISTTRIALPPESYRPAAEWGRTLRLTEIPAHRILAVLPVLGVVPLRSGAWPGDARVVEHDSLGALIATGPVSLASLGAEVACAGGRWPREAAVRLEALVAVDGGAVGVRPRISVARPPGSAEPVCWTGTTGRDRAAAFAADVAAALRQAARMGVPVPLRPRP